MLEAATDWLSRHPTTGKPLSAGTRRYLMKSFPYGVFIASHPKLFGLWVWFTKNVILRIGGICCEWDASNPR